MEQTPYSFMKNKMKAKHIFFAIAFFLTSSLIAFTNTLSNAFMLLADRSNSIPSESSILFFDPYIIDQGSSNNWIYGKDRLNYYYFSHEEDAPYIYISKSNTCTHFDKSNYRTWCSAQKANPR